jgi:hypothetical protein
VPLFRRREVWLPTLWGGLLLLAGATVVVVALALHAYDLLAPHRPARGPTGEGARTLIVEGWMQASDLQQAIAVVRDGRYERVLTTGGPIVDSWSDGATGWRNYAERAAAYLRAHGVTGVPVIAVETPDVSRYRSYLSAVRVRDWVQQAGVAGQGVDLYSAGAHARRSWLVYRMAFGDAVEIGVLAAQPVEYDARRWWTTSDGTKTTLSESLSLAWTKCCFWPDPTVPK